MLNTENVPFHVYHGICCCVHLAQRPRTGDWCNSPIWFNIFSAPGFLSENSFEICDFYFLGARVMPCLGWQEIFHEIFSRKISWNQKIFHNVFSFSLNHYIFPQEGRAQPQHGFVEAVWDQKKTKQLAKGAKNRWWLNWIVLSNSFLRAKLPNFFWDRIFEKYQRK